jgi:glycosyltransferase involved in cell wall biosynthesis
VSARILHVFESARIENSAQIRIVRDLITAAGGSRFDWHCCFLRGDGPLSEILHHCGAAVHHVAWSGDRHDLRGALRFYRFLQSGRFDLLHQHFGNQLLRALARLAGIPATIYHAHSRVLENAHPGRLISTSARFSDAVITTSRAVATGIRCKSAAHVIYPGVALSVSTSLPSHSSSAITVGAIARLVPLKGLRYLIEAVRLLRDRNIDLEIAGAGPEESALRDIAQRFGLAPRIRFLGWVQPTTILPRWDVFAMPSLEEAFGIAALEAMAAGLPVVATNVGGLPELIRHGETGFLVPPRNAFLLALHLEQLLVDPSMRVRMGSAARRRAGDHFSVEAMVEKISTVYADLLNLTGEKTA